jgi:hypothetical protein
MYMYVYVYGAKIKIGEPCNIDWNQ